MKTNLTAVEFYEIYNDMDAKEGIKCDFMLFLNEDGSISISKDATSKGVIEKVTFYGGDRFIVHTIIGDVIGDEIIVKFMKNNSPIDMRNMIEQKFKHQEKMTFQCRYVNPKNMSDVEYENFIKSNPILSIKDGEMYACWEQMSYE